MTRETSLYLDLVRLTAALLVLIVHSHGMGLTGGFLWQLAGFGQTAVMVFFVLSGYVISFVASTREDSLGTFLCARAARLYSVIVPALLITMICNAFGGNVDSGGVFQDAFHGPWDAPPDDQYLSYLVTLMMAQEIWSIGWSPANNGPFWSITFEAIYYLMFAAIYHVDSRWLKMFSLVVLAAIAGPTVVALFPIWLLGCLAFHLHSRQRISFRPPVAWFIFISALVLLAASPMYRSFLHLGPGFINRESLPGDYLDGALFFAHLAVAPIAARTAGGLLKYASRPIVFAASLSFMLYLVHNPLVRFLAGVSPFIVDPGSIANRLFVFGLLAVVVLVAGLQAERWKKSWNTWLCTRFRIAHRNST